MSKDDEVSGRQLAAWSVGGLIALLALTWIFQGNDFFLYRVFAPKQEAVRRDVFKQSQAYNDGMANQLSDMQREYANADDAHKALLASSIYHRYASYDVTQLPPDLQSFLASVRYTQLHSPERKP